MSVVLEAIEAARREGEPQLLVNAVPYMRALGLEVTLDEHGVLATLRFADHIIGNPMLPAIHGAGLPKR